MKEDLKEDMKVSLKTNTKEIMEENMDDTIVYSVIAKGVKPLVEYKKTKVKNIEKICLNYLPKVEEDSSKVVILDENVILYTNRSDITFMILVGPNYPKLVAMNCVKDIDKAFMDKFQTRDLNIPQQYGLNSEFKSILSQKINYYNINKVSNIEYYKRLHNQISDLKEKIVKNPNINEGAKIMINQKMENLEVNYKKDIQFPKEQQPKKEGKCLII